LEKEWAATDRAILHEALPTTAGGVDGDVILFAARWADVARVGFERHQS
jgi:hypothetical protein